MLKPPLPNKLKRLLDAKGFDTTDFFAKTDKMTYEQHQKISKLCYSIIPSDEQELEQELEWFAIHKK